MLAFLFSLCGVEHWQRQGCAAVQHSSIAYRYRLSVISKHGCVCCLGPTVVESTFGGGRTLTFVYGRGTKRCFVGGNSLPRHEITHMDPRSQ